MRAAKKRRSGKRAGRARRTPEQVYVAATRKERLRFTTAGIRLVGIPNPTRVFTYKVLVPHDFKPGDVVVVDAAGAVVVGIIIRVDDRPQLDGPFTYKWLRHKVVELHGRDVEAEPVGGRVRLPRQPCWPMEKEDG